MWCSVSAWMGPHYHRAHLWQKRRHWGRRKAVVLDKGLHMLSVWNMWCIINGRCTVLPFPDCCAPPQSPGRKSTHNSHTLQHAGNEVLKERQRQRVEVYFCTVTTTVHVEYFRDLYKAVYDWGWPRLPVREQAISSWSLARQGSSLSLQKQPWQPAHIHMPRKGTMSIELAGR